jgi:flagellar biogenesis protein FliO
MKDFKIDEKEEESTKNLLSKEEESTKNLLSKEDLEITQNKMIKIFVALSFILGLLILGLYFVV